MLAVNSPSSVRRSVMFTGRDWPVAVPVKRTHTSAKAVIVVEASWLRHPGGGTARD
jgi:hypothetical protein